MKVAGTEPDRPFRWPAEGVTRVPYRVFVDPAIYQREQERIFRGPVWSYVALAAELPKPGDFKATFVGDTPIVVSRDKDGSLHAFVNRCAHRGALVCREARGNRASHVCVYHQWSYDLRGRLIGVPFRKGIEGKGGYPPTSIHPGSRFMDFVSRRTAASSSSRSLERPNRWKTTSGLRSGRGWIASSTGRSACSAMPASSYAPIGSCMPRTPATSYHASLLHFFIRPSASTAPRREAACSWTRRGGTAWGGRTSERRRPRSRLTRIRTCGRTKKAMRSRILRSCKAARNSTWS